MVAVSRIKIKANEPATVSGKLFKICFKFTKFSQQKNDKKGRKGKENLEDLKKEVEMDEHKIALEELIKRLKTDTTKGLSSDQAKAFLVRGKSFC